MSDSPANIRLRDIQRRLVRAEAALEERNTLSAVQRADIRSEIARLEAEQDSIIELLDATEAES